MNTVHTILFSTLIFVATSQICDEPGECIDSIFLGSVPANDSLDCLKKCRNDDSCTFGSYTPDYNPNLCLLFQTCTKLGTHLCPNCHTSSTECAQCDISGLCLGQILHFDTTKDKVACWSLCKSTKGCSWFSFDSVLDKTCILFENCPQIESNPQFVSGQKECSYTNGGKYLIAGGWVDVPGSPGQHEMTEVVELIKTNSTPSFGQLPSNRYGPIGAMFDNAPILCGGYDGSYLNSCISFQNSQWSQSHIMIEERSYSAGVKINSNVFNNTLWVLGGYAEPRYGYYSDNTEFIIQGQTNGPDGPKLPYGLRGMCAVKLSEQEIFVIGGEAGDFNYKNEVWIYDPQNGFARNQGPSLNMERAEHSCSTMRDAEKIFIVAAGGYNGAYLDSVEIYDPTDNTWHSGPTLPYALRYSAMAEFPDGRGVLLFGGDSSENGYEDRILELHFGSNSWNILNITLKYRRGTHAVIPLQ